MKQKKTEADFLNWIKINQFQIESTYPWWIGKDPHLVKFQSSKNEKEKKFWQAEGTKDEKLNNEFLAVTLNA